MEPESSSPKYVGPRKSLILPAGPLTLDELDVPLSILAVLAVTGTTCDRVAVPGDWISELAQAWLKEVVEALPFRS